MTDPQADSSARLGALVGEVALENEEIAYRRDRLLSALTLIAGVGLALATPFALQAGATFFLPVTTAIVIALVLVPLLEWFQRRGVPAGLAALFSLLLFLAVVNIALVAVVIPAADWARLLPAHIKQVHATLAPLLDAVKAMERMSEQVTRALGQAATARTRVVAEKPSTLLGIIAESAPGALAQGLLALLLVYFLLAGWTRMRDSLIRTRQSLSASRRVARLIREVVENTARYILTISSINLTLGALVALACWALGMPTPLMWGGLAALFNFVPYAGPAAMAGLLALGGLVAFVEPAAALLPAGAFLLLHGVEANVVTPKLVGRQLTLSPLAILLSLSFWGWVWGTMGALVSVPLLIMMRVIASRVGTPDILGFLFEERTLTKGHGNSH